MALNTVFASSDNLREIWPVASEISAGTPLINNTRAGVALTDSGGKTRSVTFGPYTLSGIPSGGVGLKALEVTVATDGTFEFASVAGYTTAATQGTPVYITSGGALTMTSTSNTLFGWVNYPEDYIKSNSKTPVKIGI